jgi:hypothetical protein
MFSIGTKMANTSIISATVLDSKGEPVADARAYFIDGPVPLADVATLTDDSGNFSLTAPAAGTYQIECSAEGFATATVTISVSNGQDVQVEIRLGK